ncbi:16S rRNA (cytidine(1402)-2'-O)-methyltransferase [Microbulbifer flavimaris]|uniref:Ribosomal RNA small subunit methyltransferase I n=1 Tax=Microbulbifer flavimaris TaxID=1781068 RepID=A0ABX4HZ18_9GAMM|nr:MULTISPECIES: 16S rRNA (cytidine(1402)-2'-O)-methyltransferase [Microbulbifer]KUJ83230.1 tetrapyrrole methylase [Microbulbifer sp. ZGT114]PCO05377.1 16S rRNA (cytidine(1402)-2'-O)-methyltransferase [Microbulbifer flavimaris]
MGPDQVLYVVATPIGNLADMVPRAIEVLQSADLVAAEDTRHSQRLFSHFSITTPLVAYHDHSDDKRTGELLAQLEAGQTIALISDAGTPLISDPGYRLVREARSRGIRVVPVPGACAFVAALSAAGLPSDRFSFEGFLPSKSGTRANALQALSADPRTLVFYEAPHRVADTLDAMAKAFGGDREAVIARELTKAFETFHMAPLRELAAWVRADSNQQRGEIVLMVRGADVSQTGEVDAEAQRVMKLLMAELPPKRAAALAAEITGVKKKALYNWALEQKP